MKRIALVTVICLAAPLLGQTNVSPSAPLPGTPEDWKSLWTFIASIGVALAAVGRIIVAIRNGGGLKGILAGLFGGTNQPKP